MLAIALPDRSTSFWKKHPKGCQTDPSGIEGQSDEKALKKYGRSSFVFVGGTGLTLEQVTESNDPPDEEQVEADEGNSAPSDKKSSGR